MSIWKNWLNKKIQENNSLGLDPTVQEINRYLKGNSVIASLGQKPGTILVTKHFRPMSEAEPPHTQSIEIEVYQDDYGLENYSCAEFGTKYDQSQFFDMLKDIKVHFSRDEYSTHWESPF